MTVIALFVAAVAFGQSGSIEGKVFEEKLGSPMLSASVSLTVNGELQGTTTDPDGRFRIKPLPPGTYNVEISFTGFQTITIEKVVVHRDKITRIEPQILQPGIDLAGVTISYVKPVIDFESPGKMTMKGAELMETPLSRDPIAFVASMGDGMVQQDSNKPLYIRGGRADAVKYVIDGINAREGISLPSSAIGEISVYTSGIPAQYGDVLSGVIVVETKSYFDLYNQWKADQD